MQCITLVILFLAFLGNLDFTAGSDALSAVDTKVDLVEFRRLIASSVVYDETDEDDDTEVAHNGTNATNATSPSPENLSPVLSDSPSPEASPSSEESPFPEASPSPEWTNSSATDDDDDDDDAEPAPEPSPAAADPSPAESSPAAETGIDGSTPVDAAGTTEHIGDGKSNIDSAAPSIDAESNNSVTWIAVGVIVPLVTVFGASMLWVFKFGKYTHMTHIFKMEPLEHLPDSTVLPTTLHTVCHTPGVQQVMIEQTADDIRINLEDALGDLEHPQPQPTPVMSGLATPAPLDVC